MIGAALLKRSHSEVNQLFSAFSKSRKPGSKRQKKDPRAAVAALADPSSSRLERGV
jgi:hypothetical protein